MQNDIKRVLAYSTVSQLGYMFLACGVGAYSAGIFHLMTHAFFKALLFLAAGSVIHGLGGEQDMRKMGGLRKHMPITFWTMTMAVFAISGFLHSPASSPRTRSSTRPSRKAPAAKSSGSSAWSPRGMTSFYMFRLWYLTFLGERRASGLEDHGAPVHARSDTKLSWKPSTQLTKAPGRCLGRL